MLANLATGLALEEALEDGLLPRLAAAAKKEPEEHRWPAVLGVARALQAGAANGLLSTEAAAEALAVVLPLLAPPADAPVPTAEAAAAAVGAAGTDPARGAHLELLRAFEAASRCASLAHTVLPAREFSLGIASLRCESLHPRAAPNELMIALSARLSTGIASADLFDRGGRAGALFALAYLVANCPVVLVGRRDAVVAALRPLCKDKELRTRRGLAQAVQAIGTVGWLSAAGGADLVRFLVAQCAITDEEVEAHKKSYFASLTGKRQDAPSSGSGAGLGSGPLGGNGGSGAGSAAAAGTVAWSPEEVRRAAEEALGTLARCQEAEAALWPLLLEALMSPQATSAARAVAEACLELLKRRLTRLRGLSRDAILGTSAAAPLPPPPLQQAGNTETPDLPTALLARLTVLLHSAAGRGAAASAILEFLPLLSPIYTGRAITDATGAVAFSPSAAGASQGASAAAAATSSATLAASIGALSASASRFFGRVPSVQSGRRGTEGGIPAGSQSEVTHQPATDDVGALWAQECPALSSWLAERSAASTGRDGLRRWRATDQSAWDEVVLELARRCARRSSHIAPSPNPVHD